MVNKKLAGLLLIPALAASIGASQAISSSASQILQAVLGSFVDVQALTVGTVPSTTIDAGTGNFATALVSKFQIDINTPSQQLYLKATAASDTNPNEVAFFQQGSNVYVVFASTTNKPLSTSIGDCKLATPTNNPNAIAYPVASVALTNGGTSTFDATKNQYKINLVAGRTVSTTTTGTIPYAGTYSYLDTAGTYQAIATLSTTSL